MSDPRLAAIRDIVQEDAAERGLRTDRETNLVSAFPDDFAGACASMANHPHARLAVLTGFPIPDAYPAACETDGPLGAVFLARALMPLGIDIVLATDPLARRALESGLGACSLRKQVPVVILPSSEAAREMTPEEYRSAFGERAGPITHLIALERVGPGHTVQSIHAQPGTSPEATEAFQIAMTGRKEGRCRTMHGEDVTELVSPAHVLFEGQSATWTTIGIGDGGNEIGMGKLPWDTVRRNIANGGVIACRIATDFLVVCGVSNWGAYGLAAGVRCLRQEHDAGLFDPEREAGILETMVEHGPLVDGVTGKQTATVDGLAFERHAEVLRHIAKALGGSG